MWVTAIMLGLAGSFHCLGMCSPLAMAVTGIRNPFFINRLLYNGGRLLTYGILGSLITIAGSLLQFATYQNVLSIALGIALIIFAVTGTTNIQVPVLSRLIAKVTAFIKKMFAKFLSQKSPTSITAMGMLNGLLPCGLTYLALTYCISLPSLSQGFLFMIVFGFGTLPVMLGLTTVLQALINRFHLSFRKLSTAVMMTMGLLLVFRGYYVTHHHDVIVTSEIVICK